MSSQMETFSTTDDFTALFPLPYRGHFSVHREDIFSEDEFPLAVICLTDHPDLGLHTHDFTELVLVLGGSARHMTEEGEYLIHPGDVFVIPPGVAHGYSECDRLELVNIVYETNRLNLPNTGLKGFPGYRALFTLEPAFRSRHEFKGRLHLPPHKCREMTQLVSDLQEELCRHKDGFHYISLTLLQQIIGQLSRIYTEMETSTSRSFLRLARVLQHIETHYTDDLKLEDLAKVAGMSTRTLQRYFQETFAMSPIHFLNRLRVGNACKELVRGNSTITEVAESVGIVDSNYFSRLFQQLVGISPSAYRKTPSSFTTFPSVH
jgi:AraC-like DNA-binding protein/quercetin dioxygenase-like cupin family protein